MYFHSEAPSMNTLHKRIVLAIAVILVAGVTAYWYWSPYLAMRELRDAAVAADAGRFNEHVDFPKLRESLKSQFSARMNQEMGEGPGNAFGSMLAHALVDRMIDVAVRPETIMFAMREGKFKIENKGAGEGTQNTGGRKKVAWSTERQGLNTMVFHVEGDRGAGSKDNMALVMQREGFANWKLTDIRLPD
jgi:hypothetical protein